MKVTVYELLGMIKDGKAPKKIRYIDKIFNYDKLHADYVFMETYGESNTREYLTDWIGLSKDGLTNEVEIIEEKKIPEKLPYYSLEKIQKAKNKDEWREERISLLEKRVEDLHIKMNELLDYLITKGE